MSNTGDDAEQAELEVFIDLDEQKVVIQVQEVQLTLDPQTARDLAFSLTTASYQIEEG